MADRRDVVPPATSLVSKSMSAAIAFRVDASPQIGTGHFMRCLTLADALSQRGALIRFVSRHVPGELRQIVGDRGHQLGGVDGVSLVEDFPEVPHAHWLGTSQRTDAHDTRHALSDQSWSWLVVDHYALNATWEEALRGTAHRILAIDDLADRVHDCDVLLDQNHFIQGESRYLGKVPPTCRVIVGPRYALLRPEYRENRERLGSRTGDVHRILIFFGGVDTHNLTRLALQALSEPELRHLAVDVVSGSDASRRRDLDRLAEERPGTRVYGPRPHLADLMAHADLAIGSGGATTWERMCLGLPSLVITFADNQVPLSQELAQDGLIRLVGHAPNVTVNDIRDQLLDELRCRQQTASIDKCMELSDGLGVSRVVELMLHHTGDPRAVAAALHESEVLK